MSLLLEKIEEVLGHREHKLSDLADQLGIEENRLREAFHTNTLEIRVLERISKELKIPLYRFFREPVGNLLESSKDGQSAQYVSSDEFMHLKLQLDVALKEIELMKLELEARDRQIEELKRKLI